MKKLITLLAFLILGTAIANAQAWETLPGKKMMDVHNILLKQGYQQTSNSDNDLAIYNKTSATHYKVTLSISPQSKIVNAVTVCERVFDTYLAAEKRYNEIKKEFTDKYNYVEDKNVMFHPYSATSPDQDKINALSTDKADIFTLYQYDDEKYVNVSIGFDYDKSKVKIHYTYIDMAAREAFDKEKKEKQ
jgi:hypothetical protein